MGDLQVVLVSSVWLSDSVTYIHNDLAGKEFICNAGDTGDSGLIPGRGRLPGASRKWQLIPVFLPEKAHEQRSLASTRLKRLSTNAYICVYFFRFFSLKKLLQSNEYSSLF